MSVATIRSKLKKANLADAKTYPGEPLGRQPVHTVYGGAQLFRADTAKKIGELSQKALREHAPDAATLQRVLGFAGDQAFANRVYARVEEKLRREAVEDFRIDFEDGYGNRPDCEEDDHAAFAAQEVARGQIEHTLPPFIGIRIKPFSEELFRRSERTLRILLSRHLPRH